MSWDDLKFDKDRMWEIVYGPTGIDMMQANCLPAPQLVFKAFELTPFDQVKVVILGQDPYPTRGHAHGLAFSVPPNVKPLPPSLRNIFTEYVSDLSFPYPRNGDLTLWARRGVLLQNTILTVQEGKPLSHKGLGWEKLCIEAIQKLSSEREHIVFVLWGNNAREFKGLIDQEKHCVIESVHPSPLAARNGFFGSRPFTRANIYLDSCGLQPVDWRLT